MNRKACYRDMQRYQETCRKQKDRYYKQFNLYEIKPFTSEQDELILAHEIPDRELSSKIQVSVRRIQVRRCRLKKAIIK